MHTDDDRVSGGLRHARSQRRAEKGGGFAERRSAAQLLGKGCRSVGNKHRRAEALHRRRHRGQGSSLGRGAVAQACVEQDRDLGRPEKLFARLE